jgi:hypothetical protein
MPLLDLGRFGGLGRVEMARESKRIGAAKPLRRKP